ncbi:MAG TPA: alpha/beta fold hydrolase [Micromonospora sp.]
MAEILLFCLPYAGGSAQRIYGKWGRQLPDHIEVVPVEPPGRGSRIMESPLTSVEAITNDLIDRVVKRIDRPYAIFGHSLGALVAFELARRLEYGQGRPVSHLFVSGHAAPQLPLPPDNDYLLPDAEFKVRLRELAGTPEEVLADEDLLDLVVPIIRADFQAADTYQWRPGLRLNCPMTVYGGQHDPEAMPDTLPRWKEHTTARCDVRVLPGNHFFLHHEERALLDGIAEDLERARLPLAPPTNGRTS